MVSVARGSLYHLHYGWLIVEFYVCTVPACCVFNLLHEVEGFCDLRWCNCAEVIGIGTKLVGANSDIIELPVVLAGIRVLLYYS